MGTTHKAKGYRFKHRGYVQSTRVCLALCSTFCSRALLAAAPQLQPPVQEEAVRNAARELGFEGDDAMEKGDWHQAWDLFHRAYQLVPAPTLAVREARALTKLGKLIEAEEAYLRAAQANLEPTSPEPFRKAVEEAKQEVLTLRLRIPHLTIVVQPISTIETDVRLDGSAVPPALIGVERTTNPGTHYLEAHAQSQGATLFAENTLTLGEGVRQTVVLQLASTGTKNTQRTLGWIALGVGGASIGLGVMAGLIATSKYSNLESNCPMHVCTNPAYDYNTELNSYHSARITSFVGYGVGIVGLGTGLTLLLTTRSTPSTTHTAVSPWVAPNAAGVQGVF